MLFYIVKHATFENENVIFTDEVSAINYIEKRIKELTELYDYDKDYKLFKIVTVKEGERFDAYIQM
tara:strand:- start:73 stop:270 length:198 start_codon:yes stop_codon:yes gene_type:complete